MVARALTIMLIYLGIALLVAGQIMKTQRTNRYFRHFPEEFKLLVALIVGITWLAWLIFFIGGAIFVAILWALGRLDDKS